MLANCCPVLWQLGDVERSRCTLPCLILSLPGSILLAIISYLEHQRSIRPSTLFCLFFGITCLLDTARVRTAFMFLNSLAVFWVLLCCFIVKVAIFLAEVTEKRRFLKPAWKNVGPEKAAGVFNRAFFIWLNKTFIKGFRALLTVDLLSALDSEILEASKPTILMASWTRGTMPNRRAPHCLTSHVAVLIALIANQTKEHSLFFTFLWYNKWAFLAGTLPRLAYTGFSYSQPFLVERVLDFVAEERTPDSKNTLLTDW